MSILQSERGGRVAGHRGDGEPPCTAAAGWLPESLSSLSKTWAGRWFKHHFRHGKKHSAQPPHNQLPCALVGGLRALLSQKVCQGYRLKVLRIPPSVP
ncbi:hypothetical protein N5C67_03980, partial [Comamonas thiooxydans]|uniref:hypothetical protein n=1 Tax=Comamonas thiooxydans TaxID=363952 RepID=UPI00244692F5